MHNQIQELEELPLRWKSPIWDFRYGWVYEGIFHSNYCLPEYNRLYKCISVLHQDPMFSNLVWLSVKTLAVVVFCLANRSVKMWIKQVSLSPFLRYIFFSKKREGNYDLFVDNRSRDKESRLYFLKLNENHFKIAWISKPIFSVTLWQTFLGLFRIA